MKSGSKFLLQWIAATIAISVAVAVTPGLSVDNGFVAVAAYAILGLILTLLNTAFKPLLRVITLPIILITLGIFLLVINTFLLYVAVWITNALFATGFTIDGLGSALTASLIISIVTLGINVVTGANKDKGK